MAIKFQPIIKKYIKIFSDVLSDKFPYETQVGEQCFKPHKCPFFEHCWKNIPPYSVFNISRLKKSKAVELLEAGIISPMQIPKGYKLSTRQQIEVYSATSGKPYIDIEKLSKFLDELETDKSLLFLDFETISPSVPLYEGMYCYQHVCFQYSLIKKDKNDKWWRKDFLAKTGSDPRQKFIESLLYHTEGVGKIIVFNKSFEITRLRELAAEFTKYRSQIEDRVSRICDLMTPFAEHYYYHPEFHGSSSLKKILPVICPEYKGYSDLIIKDGLSAMSSYENLDLLSLNEQAKTRQALKDYCFTDTMGMVKIIQFLTQIGK